MSGLVSLRPRSAMRPLQVRCVESVLALGRILLALGTGYGKTCIALTVLIDLLARLGRRPLMIYVGPPAVAATVPLREAAQWAHLAHLKVVPLVGTPSQRLALLRKRDYDVLTVSYQLLPWLLENAAEIGQAPDVVVLDECTKAKSIRSKTFRSCLALARSAPVCIGMAAMPAARGHVDLYGQIFLLDFGKRLGATFGAYTAKWFVPFGQFGDFRPRNQAAVAEINAAITDIALAPRDDEKVDLPPLIELNHEVDLPPAARAEYERLEGGLLLGDPVDPSTILGRLAQIAGGSVYGLDGAVREVHTAKLDRLEDLIEEIGEPVIACYRYTHMRDAILARIKGSVAWDSSSPAAIGRTIDAFAAGRIRVLVAHPQSFGHGVDGLQKGGRHLIWADGPPMFSLEALIQTQGRLHRPGVRDTVFVHTITARGTVDEVISQILRGRLKGQDALLQTLAAYLRTKHGAAASDDLAERLKQARRDVQRSHPDVTKTDASAAEFIAAKARLDQLKKEQADASLRP